MARVILCLCICFSAISVVPTFGDPDLKWTKLDMQFSLAPALAFYAQPQTVGDALADGFKKLNGCEENKHFAGERYARKGQNDIVLIFDINGFIAGVQTIVPLGAGYASTIFNYSLSDSYVQDEHFDGKKVHYATAYFVDPKIICDKGRDQDTFRDQGIGDNLRIQHGTHPDNVTLIPRTQHEMKKDFDGIFYEHHCFTNMGIHYMNFNYMRNQTCQEIIPFQFLYDTNGDLRGFVFQHFARLWADNNMYEQVDSVIVPLIVQNPPSCAVMGDDLGGSRSSLHIYFVDFDLQCPPSGLM